MKLLKIQVFLRSFLLHAFWNFERMQNIGFLYTVLPVLKKAYPQKEQRRDAMRRHSEFFNTHPYFASLLIGIVAGMEERVDTAKKEEIMKLKSQLAGPLAAIGDVLFWGTWRPLVGLMGCSLVFLGLHEFMGGWWVPIIFLSVYNIPHVWLRWKGISLGWKTKTGVIQIVKRLYHPKILRHLERMGIMVLGVSLAAVFYRNYNLWSDRAIFLVSLFCFGFAHFKAISSIKLFYLFFLVGILASCL